MSAFIMTIKSQSQYAANTNANKQLNGESVFFNVKC